MAEQNSTQAVLLSEVDPGFRAAFYLGASDALAGREFSPEYESFDYSDQLAYEAGRLLFRNISLAGLRFPWGDHVAVDDAAIRASARVGRAVPPDWGCA